MRKTIISLFERREYELQSLNGLRAVAILLIIIFHLGSVLVEQGLYQGLPIFLKSVMKNFESGVDLFFILSGFLISGGLLRYFQSRKSGYFSNFYLKRILRIFPAYYAFLIILLLMVVLQIGHLEKISDQSNALLIKLKEFRGLMIFDFLYLTNIVPGAHLHTWSLSTEEQFYIIFPIFTFYILFRLKAKKRLWLLGIIYLSFLALRLAVIADIGLKMQHFISIRFAIDRMRFDSILVGVFIMQIYEFRRGKELILSGKKYAIVLAAGFIILLFGHMANFLMPFYAFDYLEHNFYNIGYGLIFVAALEPGRQWSAFLSSRIFIPIARLSYGMYLWHISFMALAIGPFVPYLRKNGVGHFGALALLAYGTIMLMIFCAMAYLLVERPFLRVKERMK